MMDDLRARIQHEIQQITAWDNVELAHRSHALSWLALGAPIFRTKKPATPPKHLVSYFVVTDGTHLLLVDHRNAGLWLPPGGHVEPHEHPRATVVREIEEELGIATSINDVGSPRFITVTETVGSAEKHTDVSLWYVVFAHRDTPITFDAKEFHNAKWFAPTEIPFERSEPHLRRFIAKSSGTRKGK